MWWLINPDCTSPEGVTRVKQAYNELVLAYRALRDWIAADPAHAAVADNNGHTAVQLLNLACGIEPLVNINGDLVIFTWKATSFSGLGQERVANLELIRRNFVNLVVGLATRREVHARVKQLDTDINEGRAPSPSSATTTSTSTGRAPSTPNRSTARSGPTTSLSPCPPRPSARPAWMRPKWTRCRSTPWRCWRRRASTWSTLPPKRRFSRPPAKAKVSGFGASAWQLSCGAACPTPPARSWRRTTGVPTWRWVGPTPVERSRLLPYSTRCCSRTPPPGRAREEARTLSPTGSTTFRFDPIVHVTHKQ